MTTAATGSTQPTPRAPRKLMAAGLVGSSIEWYDFFIYATAAALVFGELFFPGASPLVGALLAFSTFWAGFVARPIGGLVFGHFGDRVGRKPALVTSLVLMASATFLIGLMPTTAAIGVAAPIVLVVLRFLQGIAVGGQWGGIALLLTESAKGGRRGFAGAFGQVGVPLGVILGNVAFLVTGAAVSPEAFTAWGWRIPFLASALLFPVVLFIQLRIEDTPVFQELQERKKNDSTQVVQAPLKEALRTHWRTILLAAGLLFASNATFYISIAGLLDYATRDLGLAYNPLLAIALVGAAVGGVAIFVSAALSDRLGRRPLVLAGSGLIVVWAFPFFWLVDTASLVLITVATAVGGIGSSLVYGPLAAYMNELFAAHVRYSGASMAYQLAAILISGGTPFIMTALLAATGTSASVSAFMLVMGLATFFSALALEETRPTRPTADSSEGTAPASSSAVP